MNRHSWMHSFIQAYRVRFTDLFIPQAALLPVRAVSSIRHSYHSTHFSLSRAWIQKPWWEDVSDDGISLHRGSPAPGGWFGNLPGNKSPPFLLLLFASLHRLATEFKTLTLNSTACTTRSYTVVRVGKNLTTHWDLRGRSKTQSTQSSCLGSLFLDLSLLLHFYNTAQWRQVEVKISWRITRISLSSGPQFAVCIVNPSDVM